MVRNVMIIETILGICMAVNILGLMLLVFFGQKTMRKLRKNPDTKHALGIELVSGYDIVNVMSALTFPKLTNKLNKSPFSAFDADAELVKRYTTRFDRILAKIATALLISSVSCMLGVSILDKIGVFK